MGSNKRMTSFFPFMLWAGLEMERVQHIIPFVDIIISSHNNTSLSIHRSFHLPLHTQPITPPLCKLQYLFDREDAFITLPICDDRRHLRRLRTLNQVKLPYLPQRREVAAEIVILERGDVLRVGAQIAKQRERANCRD